MHLPRWAHSFLDFCYPGKCASCDRGYDAAAMLCPDCETEMQLLADAPACGFCAMPLADHGTPCPHCLGKGLAHLDRVASLGVFREPLKNTIHHAKYSRCWPLAEQLAEHLLHQPHVENMLFETDYLVPVPLHRRRQRERGYNQSDVIARRLGSKCRIKVKTPAVRIRDTETQTHMRSRASRTENLRGAFVLRRPQMVVGKHIVLVDDVMTTGATLISLARTLQEAKPASVSAIVIAVADPRGREFEVI